MIRDFLLDAYPWIKSLHVISVIAWMAGIFYLPRLFVYHAEKAAAGSELDKTFQVMERRLLRGIMNPALIATWTFGLLMVLTPGMIDWGQVWPWLKTAAVLAITWLHYWLAQRRKDFARGENTRSGRTYRIMNEVPTLAMMVIVLMVIAKPF